VSLALLAWIPLLRALSPFPALAIDPSWELARAWVLPVALGGASAGLAFLTRHAPLLAHLDPRTRWGGELGALLLAPALWSVALTGGAVVAAAPEGRIASDAARFLFGCARLDLDLAALGILWLRVPTTAPIRVLGLWGTVWFLPALMAGTRIAHWLDASRLLAFDARSAGSTATGWPELATLSLSTAGLLVVGRFLPTPRASSGPPAPGTR